MDDAAFWQIHNGDGAVVAEFESLEAATRYADSAANGPFTVVAADAAVLLPDNE